MASHSEIFIPPECGFIIWLQNTYGAWEKKDNNNIVKLDAFIDELFECKKMDTWKLNKTDVKEKILANQPMNYAELCAVIYITYAISIEKETSIWGDKNNYYLNHLPELLELYKTGKFLHIVRDGRDVACSCREVMDAKTDSPYAPKLDTNIEDIAKQWSNDVSKIDIFVAQLSDNNSMTIKYEDLVSEPEATVRKICKWLSIPFEASVTDFYKENKEKKLEPDMTLDWKKRTLEPISSKTVGRYSRLLSEDEQHDFCTTAYDMLKKFGYISLVEMI